jgi:hypothetical protein
VYSRTPNNFKQTSLWHSWIKEEMAKAIRDIRKKKMKWLLVSMKYNVPQTTLCCHFNKVPKFKVISSRCLHLTLKNNW